MTSHEYAKMLLDLEDLPMMIYKESDESSTYLDKPYKVYTGRNFARADTIFENEVEEFGHSWEDVQPVGEVMS